MIRRDRIEERIKALTIEHDALVQRIQEDTRVLAEKQGAIAELENLIASEDGTSEASSSQAQGWTIDKPAGG